MSDTKNAALDRLSRWPGYAALLAALALAAPLVTAAEAGVPDAVDPALDVYASPQQLVLLPDGRRLNLYCEGKGRPTVLLEAGAGGSTLEWRKVQKRIAQGTQVCAYDRAGMGFSEPGPLPRTAEAVVQDFTALLKAAKLEPPYVLVAHSLGSYFVRIYADRHITNVAGMVLIDPSVEYQDRRFIELNPPYAELLRQGDDIARKCLELAQDGTLKADSPIFKDCTYGYRRDPTFSDALYKVQIDRRLSVKFRAALYSETQEMDADSHMLAHERRSFGDLPLIVLTQSPEGSKGYPGLTAAQVDAQNALWFKMHDELASLSSRGSNRRVDRSGHYIQLDRAEIVVAAVREVVKAGQTNEPPH